MQTEQREIPSVLPGGRVGLGWAWLVLGREETETPGANPLQKSWARTLAGDSLTGGPWAPRAPLGPVTPVGPWEGEKAMKSGGPLILDS